MKLSSRVVWSEGMYLGPQHFQAHNRYFEDSIRFLISNLWFEAWGVVGCELDNDAIGNGTIALRHAHGIFPDGLPFSMPEADRLPASRSVTDAFPVSRDSVTVHLAIAAARIGGVNCELTDNNGSATARYTALQQPLYDETAGGEQRNVTLGRKNIRLLLDAEVTTDMVSVPIARVVRDSAGHLSFDPRFIPPCVRISASERLMQLLRRLIETMEEKSAALRAMRKNQGKYQAGWAAGEIATFWFLHSLHSALATLRHLTFSKRGHPEEVFHELSRLAGALCSFGLASDPRTLPLYDHEHLDDCFDAIERHIREHLEIMVSTNAFHIPLNRVAQYFWEADVPDQRCFGASRWLLELQAGAGEAEIITRAPTLVKFCSAKYVPELTRRALPGMTLKHVALPPAAVAPKVEAQYFSLSKAGPCWDHIMQSRRVGVYIPGEIPHARPELIVVLD